jgi:hypothetical protein
MFHLRPCPVAVRHNLPELPTEKAAVDPQPGDWVLIRAKVLERPFPETVLVELFSKTDQYPAHVRPDLCVQIVPKPLPEEPGMGSIAVIDGGVYQRLVDDHWYGAGNEQGRTWVELNEIGDVKVIDHG